MAATLLNCFQNGLLVIPIDPGLLARMKTSNVTASSGTTAIVKPPKILIHLDVRYWTAKATIHLNSPRAMVLAQNYVPATEQAELHNEAEVVRLASLYLIHRIKKAIETKYHTKIVPFSEVIQGKLRVELSFRAKTQHQQQHQDQDGPHVMLVEYKRCGLLRTEDFVAAMCEEQSVLAKLQELETGHLDYSLSPNSNGFWFTKQAVAYSQRHGSEYVAICDYHNLVLLKFDKMPFSARVTIVPPGSYRKALLGFMIEACDAAGLR